MKQNPVYNREMRVSSRSMKLPLIIFLFNGILYFEKVFQAVGRMKVTMTGMMIGCIVNIILDPLIIFGIGPFPRLGIEGAALATGWP